MSYVSTAFKVHYNQQDSQLLQRHHAAGCIIVLAKSETLEQGDNILRTL